MKTKKTRWDKRGAYTFQFNDGTSVTLRPGEDGVTEADIKVLHSLDDAEVYLIQSTIIALRTQN